MRNGCGDDYAWATLEFEDGAIGDLFASFSVAASANSHSITLHGNRQSARAVLASPRHAQEAYASALLHFAECCQTGREPISSGQDALKTMRIIAAIYESARSGMPVDLDRSGGG